MKKLMILFALVLGSTLTYAQQGYNHGNNGHRGGNGYNQGHRGGNAYHGNRGQVGYNNGNRGNNGYQRQGRTTRTTTRYYNGRGNGTYYQGGVTRRDVRPNTRIRWRNSACGTYRIRLTQERRYTAGYWTYNRGCRTWVEPVYSWHTVCSDRVYPRNNCGW